MNEKKPWQSKTLWVNALLSVAAFFPGVAEHVTPEAIGIVFGLANMVLRIITKDRVVLVK